MVKEINEYSGVVIAVISLWVVYKLINHYLKGIQINRQNYPHPK